MARLSSAKAATAVRIRFGPPTLESPEHTLGAFLRPKIQPSLLEAEAKGAKTASAPPARLSFLGCEQPLSRHRRPQGGNPPHSYLRSNQPNPSCLTDFSPLTLKRAHDWKSGGTQGSHWCRRTSNPETPEHMLSLINQTLAIDNDPKKNLSLKSSSLPCVMTNSYFKLLITFSWTP